MTRHDDMNSANLKDTAERELAAFLQAATSVIGQGIPPRAGDIWIDALEGLDWPDKNYEQFFRRVTIQAAAQLTSKPKAGMSQEENVESHV